MKINITNDVYQQIMHWVHKANYEVSGFGKCAYNEATKEIDVYSAHLLKQEGSAAMTDIDAGSLAKLMYTTKDNPGELKLWWHSHVQMAAFWSGTDLDTIKQLGGNGWCIAIVLNQRSEYKAAYCGQVQRAIGGDGIELLDDIDMEIVYPSVHEDMIKSWDAEFAANVSQRSYSSYDYNSMYTRDDTGAYRYNGFVGDKAWDRPGAVIDITKRTSLLLPGDTGVEDDDADYEPWERDAIRENYKRKYEERDPGIAIEAAAVNMTYEDYMEALERMDPTEIAEIDQKLIEYWNDGQAAATRKGSRKRKNGINQ